MHSGSEDLNVREEGGGEVHGAATSYCSPPLHTATRTLRCTALYEAVRWTLDCRRLFVQVWKAQLVRAAPPRAVQAGLVESQSRIGAQLPPLEQSRQEPLSETALFSP